MKTKISLVALALAGSLPMAALAAPPTDKSTATGQYQATQPAAPATAAPATPAVPQEGIGAAPPMFKQLDKDHDGQVSKDEAKAAPDVLAAFKTVDSDHNGKLSAAEWNSAEHDGKLKAGKGG